MIATLRSPLFRRLFCAVGLLALLPLLATAGGAALLVRSAAREATAARLRSDAIVVREAARPLIRAGDEAGLDRLAKDLARGLGMRLTFVAGSGRVLGDSEHDPKAMENHAERPEVRAAREEGAGEARRRSDTLGEEMLYVAVRADPGDAAAGVGLGIFAGAVHDLTRAAESVAAGGALERTVAEDRTDEVGALARAVHAMADELSARVRVLAREQNELATVIAGLGEGLIAVDRAGRLLLFNRAAARLFGLAAPPEPGRPLSDALPHGGVVGLAREALETGAAREATVEVYAPREASARAVEVRAAPFKERTVEIAGAVLVLRDVTESQRYERLRREFVANVSHELRTPLALVKGALETLEDGALGDAERGPRFLEMLRRHVLGLERLVADLLTLSALEAGAETRLLEPVSLTLALDEVLGPFEAVLAAKRIALGRRIPEGLPPVTGHRDQVERAIRNLVDNAVKYTPEGGTIAIEARTEGEGVALAVRDSGPGIPPDEIGRVFERFFRVDKSRSREAGGTGLGLAIVKHIMQQSGGSVAVASEIGKGTTFTLSFRAFEAGGAS